MHIAMASRLDLTRDPHARALAASLLAAGHRVSALLPAAHGPATVDGIEVVAVPDPTPSRLRRRLGRAPDLASARTRALRAAVAALDANLLLVPREADLDLTRDATAPVVGRPGWADVPRDLVELAPGAPQLAADVVPDGAHVPGAARGAASSGTTPVAGRHAGRRIAVAARFTPTNPSRYLVAALERAGVEVVRLDGAIDWDAVPDDTAAVLVVESPLPALPVTGRRPAGVPLLLWVHHGEHHADANVRLAARYGADAVLLAHSWHLAFRFGVPVHRFPFAVAPEVFDGGRPFADRDLWVAMVAAGLGDHASVRYPQRAAWTDALAPALGERAFLGYGVPPTEMAGLYGRARLVLNDAGTKHRPITMRVFEAIGSGALLVTEPLPGTELLFPDDMVETVATDLLAQVERLATDHDTARRAAAALDHALAHHTYDHRVDELLHVAAITATRPQRAEPPLTGLAAAVDEDVEVQTVAVLGALLAPGDRAVAHDDDARARLARGRFDAVVLGPDAVLQDVALAVAGARRVLLIAPEHLAAARDRLAADDRADGCVWSERHGWHHVDLGAPGYRMRPDDHPLAGEPS